MQRLSGEIVRYVSRGRRNKEMEEACCRRGMGAGGSRDVQLGRGLGQARNDLQGYKVGLGRRGMVSGGGLCCRQGMIYRGDWNVAIEEVLGQARDGFWRKLEQGRNFREARGGFRGSYNGRRIYLDQARDYIWRRLEEFNRDMEEVTGQVWKRMEQRKRFRDWRGKVSGRG